MKSKTTFICKFDDRRYVSKKKLFKIETNDWSNDVYRTMTSLNIEDAYKFSCAEYLAVKDLKSFSSINTVSRWIRVDEIVNVQYSFVVEGE